VGTASLPDAKAPARACCVARLRALGCAGIAATAATTTAVYANDKSR
jgi:hypothetical protein